MAIFDPILLLDLPENYVNVKDYWPLLNNQMITNRFMEDIVHIYRPAVLNQVLGIKKNNYYT